MQAAREASPFKRPVSSSPSAAAHGGLVPSQARRSLSRHAGRRRQARLLNSLLVSSLEQFAGLTEEELQARLDHMLVKVSHRPVFQPLQEPQNRDILRAFRSGALAQRHLVDEKPRGPDAARFATQSLRSALQALYTRVDRGLRPLLLGEVRRALSSSEDVPLIAGLELTLQRLVEGLPLAEWWCPTAVGAALFERSARPPTEPAVSEAVPMPPRRGGAGAGGLVAHRSTRLAFTDGTARMLCEAIAQCYGLKYTKSEVAGAATPPAREQATAAPSGETRGRQGRGGATGGGSGGVTSVKAAPAVPVISEWVIVLSLPVLQVWDGEEEEGDDGSAAAGGGGEGKEESKEREAEAPATTPISELLTPAGLPHPLVLTQAVRVRLQQRGRPEEDAAEEDTSATAAAGPVPPTPLLGLIVRALSGGGGVDAGEVPLF